ASELSPKYLWLNERQTRRVRDAHAQGYSRAGLEGRGTMSDAEVEPCGARFFGQDKRELGRAVQVTRRVGAASLLTVLDVAGADPELTRSLSLLDRSRLQIHC